jgi:hypothetical protein
MISKFDRAEAPIKGHFPKISRLSLASQERSTLTLVELVPMSRSRYEKSIDARDEAVDRFVKFMTDTSAVDTDHDGICRSRFRSTGRLANLQSDGLRIVPDPASSNGMLSPTATT